MSSSWFSVWQHQVICTKSIVFSPVYNTACALSSSHRYSSSAFVCSCVNGNITALAHAQQSQPGTLAAHAHAGSSVPPNRLVSPFNISSTRFVEFSPRCVSSEYHTMHTPFGQSFRPMFQPLPQSSFDNCINFCFYTGIDDCEDSPFGPSKV